jgi:hypothetical protein
MMFRNLTPEEAIEFIKGALRDYPPNMEHWEIYHPVSRMTWLMCGVGPKESAPDDFQALLLTWRMQPEDVKPDTNYHTLPKEVPEGYTFTFLPQNEEE